MAETNSTRFGLRQWSAGTDTPQRSEFTASFASIETLAAIDKQGVFGSRPAAGVVGTYYWDTTNSYLWRDTGSAWFNIGSRAQDVIFVSSATGNVPLLVNAITAQSADLLQLKVNSVQKAKVDKDGNATFGTYTGVSAALVNTVDATVVLAVKGSASQSANLVEVKNNASGMMFGISNAGAVTSPYLATSATTVVAGAAAATNVANMSFWSGNAAFEVQTKGGTGAFNDFLYLQHSAVSGSVAVRRVGVLMKTGGETAPDAARSAAVYLYSNAANGDTPQLRLDARDTNMWQIDPSAGSVTGYPVYANGSGAYFRSAPGTGSGAFRADNAWLGTQNSGNVLYLRSGSTATGFYFYGGGVHDSTEGSAGTGGSVIGSLVPTASDSLLTVGRLNLTQGVDIASAAISTPSFMIGNAAGDNLIMSQSKIMARNNGSAGVSTLTLQGDGGFLRLGSQGAAVYISALNFYIGPTAPVYKESSTIWICTAAQGAGGGIFRWNVGSSTWTTVVS